MHISGIARIGVQLTGSYTYADTDSDPQGVSTFKWYSDSASSGATKIAIGGATATTYTVQAGDLGKYPSNIVVLKKTKPVFAKCYQ